MTQTFDYKLGSSVGYQVNLGLVVLQSDETLEHDLRRMLPSDGVGFYTTRVPSAATVTKETLAQMEAELPASAGLLPPSVDFDAVAYGCTSGTAVIGADRIHDLVSTACGAAHVTDPMTALIAAVRHLNVKKIAFLSPYVAEVSRTLRGAIELQGLEIASFGSFDESSEAAVARIDKASLLSAAIEMLDACKDAEAIFLSCTNLQTLDVIEEIENKTGKICLSSNLVLGWHLMRLAGLVRPQENLGQLFANN